jgi:hypothetical protein
MNDHIFKARPLKNQNKWTLWKRRLHHYENIVLAGHLRETTDADIFPNEKIKAQQSHEFYCNCIYDLLKNVADPPTSVTKLKFYQQKIQHLQTQRAIRTYVSHRDESRSKWNLHFSPNQSTQTQTSTGNP